MGKFATPQWEPDEVGDEICKTLFKGKSKNKTKKKEKLKNSGKIIKAKLNRAKVEINEKFVKNIGGNMKNIKNIVSQKTNKIIQKHNKNKKEANTSIENGANTSQQKLIKNNKKVPKCNLPNLKHLKNMVKTKLSNEEDTKQLFAEDGDVTISETSTLEVKQKKKRKKKKNIVDLKEDLTAKIDSNIIKAKNKVKRKKKKLQEKECNATKQGNLNGTLDESEKKGKSGNKNSSLRERMMAKLKASRFRYLNEQLYCSPSKESKSLFESDPDSFKAYHDGFRQQVDRWPVNPVDVIIKSIKNMKKSLEIADFGCGDAKIAQEVKQKVHSFDLVATNERVTPCDMAKVPLNKESVDVAVFCLSLMGTNLQDYLKEANRVLKTGGILKIAEVESRFEDVDEFIKGVQHFGFQNTHKDLTHNIFYFMDFKKVANVKKGKGLPTLSLNPCLYKKR